MFARFVALVSLVLLLVLPVASASAQDEPLRMRYTGELLDADFRPFSGVFPMTFKLLPRDRNEPLWTSTRFVAVEGGMYSLTLGRDVPLPADAEGQSMILVVEIGSAGEVARHQLTVEREAVVPPPTESATIHRIPIADLAGRAVFADEATRADDGQRIGGMTARDFARYEDLRERIAELETELREGRGVTIGADRATIQRIGGEGGMPYHTECPPGYVVTGGRGGGGNLVDGFRGVCSQLVSTP